MYQLGYPGGRNSKKHEYKPIDVSTLFVPNYCPAPMSQQPPSFSNTVLKYIVLLLTLNLMAPYSEKVSKKGDSKAEYILFMDPTLPFPMADLLFFEKLGHIISLQKSVLSLI